MIYKGFISLINQHTTHTWFYSVPVSLLADNLISNIYIIEATHHWPFISWPCLLYSCWLQSYILFHYFFDILVATTLLSDTLYDWCDWMKLAYFNWTVWARTLPLIIVCYSSNTNYKSERHATFKNLMDPQVFQSNQIGYADLKIPKTFPRTFWFKFQSLYYNQQGWTWHAIFMCAVDKTVKQWWS